MRTAVAGDRESRKMGRGGGESTLFFVPWCSSSKDFFLFFFIILFFRETIFGRSKAFPRLRKRVFGSSSFSVDLMASVND